MLRMLWRSHPPMQARLKAKAQYTLATSSKIEQRFQQVSIGFLDGSRTSAQFKIRLTLEPAMEICSRFEELR